MKSDLTSKAGAQSANALRKETMKEERKVESRKGAELAKGDARFEERSKASDGRSAGQKQR